MHSCPRKLDRPVFLDPPYRFVDPLPIYCPFKLRACQSEDIDTFSLWSRREILCHKKSDDIFDLFSNIDVTFHLDFPAQHDYLSFSLYSVFHEIVTGGHSHHRPVGV